jgi:ABC-type dipeptide/oligopeptide/nickel transport system ATPase component
VSVQAAVIELLADLRSRLSLSMLFITHNLGVVAAIADHVLILDRGVICEEGPVDEVFSNPRSERAIELLNAAPTLRAAA